MAVEIAKVALLKKYVMVATCAHTLTAKPQRATTAQ
jgi:hypothetical protein